MKSDFTTQYEHEWLVLEPETEFEACLLRELIGTKAISVCSISNYDGELIQYDPEQPMLRVAIGTGVDVAETDSQADIVARLKKETVHA